MTGEVHAPTLHSDYVDDMREAFVSELFEDEDQDYPRLRLNWAQQRAGRPILIQDGAS